MHLNLIRDDRPDESSLREGFPVHADVTKEAGQQAVKIQQVIAECRLIERFVRIEIPHLLKIAVQTPEESAGILQDRKDRKHSLKSMTGDLSENTKLKIKGKPTKFKKTPKEKHAKKVLEADALVGKMVEMLNSESVKDMDEAMLLERLKEIRDEFRDLVEKHTWKGIRDMVRSVPAATDNTDDSMAAEISA